MNFSSIWTTKRLILIGAAVLLLLLAGFAALQLLRPAHTDLAWEHIQNTGTLRVGMDAAYPPFESLDAKNQIVGFDVDLANEIGQRIGIKMAFVNMAYDGLFDALLIGQVDILISGIVAAPELEGKARFSVPYFNAGETLVVKQGSAIHHIEDMVGQTLAVEIGSGGDVEGRKWQRRLDQVNIIRTQDADSALIDVINGQADAALVDGVTARIAVGQHPELVLADNVVDTLMAAAVHPDSQILAAQVDDALKDILSDGTIGKLIDKWFGPQHNN